MEGGVGPYLCRVLYRSWRQTLRGRAAGMPRHVAYLVNPSIAYVVVELSVWAAGATCVPLSVHSPAPELEYYITGFHSEHLQNAKDTKAIALTPKEQELSLSSFFKFVVGAMIWTAQVLDIALTS
eukprot:1165709-Amphidinium_carterae.1